MTSYRGILFNLNALGFDPFGRVFVADRAASEAMGDMLARVDAIACHSGCGAPLSCDTALITREELVRIGPDLVVNNADFAAIIRKRKAVDAQEAVLVFTGYREADLDAGTASGSAA